MIFTNTKSLILLFIYIRYALYIRYAFFFYQRFMFFSDNGPNPRIEKASLDGQDREVIVYSGLSRVFSLSVDILNDKLYWVDKTRHTVEVCNYDGTNRRVIRRMNGVQLTDLAPPP